MLGFSHKVKISESLCHCVSQCDPNPIYATDVKLSLMSLPDFTIWSFSCWWWHLSCIFVKLSGLTINWNRSHISLTDGSTSMMDFLPFCLLYLYLNRYLLTIDWTRCHISLTDFCLLVCCQAWSHSEDWCWCIDNINDVELKLLLLQTLCAIA